MTVQILTQAPEPGLAGALERFERGFTYPLGSGLSFSISHGQDYPRFFRAIARDASASFVAISGNGEVRGTLGVAVRPLQFPSGERRLAAYLGDLKTKPGAGRGLALFRLTAEATAWSMARGAVAAYGVVMEGTPHAPSNYTGRFGMHAFHAIERLCILRIPVDVCKRSEDGAFDAELSSVEECFRNLGSGSFAPLGGAPELRSSHSPISLQSPDHSACGIIENTRLAKRLFREDGEEMLAAHLSKFAYKDPSAGMRLIRQALARCANAALAPALFVAIPESDLNGFNELLEDNPGVVKAPASIYGTQFAGITGRWNISTSEI
jgi:hypothetical protein